MAIMTYIVHISGPVTAQLHPMAEKPRHSQPTNKDIAAELQTKEQTLVHLIAWKFSPNGTESPGFSLCEGPLSINK